MRQGIIVMLISLLVKGTFAQSTYTTYDGTEFKIGDSISIGMASGYRKYTAIKEYFTYSNGAGSYKNVQTNLKGKKFPIAEISKDNQIFYNDKTFLKVKEKGFLKEAYYINIEEAVKNGEIVLKSNPSPITKAIHFDDTLSLVSFVKHSGTPLDEVKGEYLYRFDNMLFNKTREDEFERHSANNLAKKKLEKSINETNNDQLFFINTRINLSEYNFDQEGFELDEKDMSFQMVKMIMSQFAKTSKGYTTINLELVNGNHFKLVKVAPDEAKRFIARRKDRFGNVNREVYGRIFFRLLEDQTTSTDKARIVRGQIVKIDLYEFKTFEGNYIGEVISSNQ